MSECQCELSGFCTARNVALKPTLQTLCKRNKSRIDALLSGEKPVKTEPQRQAKRSVKTSVKRPCSTCNQKRKSAVARAVDRIVSLKNAAVNFVRDGMAIATEEQQGKRSAICASCPLNNNGWCDDTKGGCGCKLSLKVLPLSSSCPLGKWSAYRDEYRPLVNPTRSLMFHLYPLRGKEWNWHWHIEQIRKHLDKFNGKIVIGVGVDNKTATMEEVQELFHGIRVDHWLRADNNKLAETLTHVEMLSLLKTDDPNAVIFRAHTKGVTHQLDSVEQKWAEIMWDSNMDLSSVDDALASHGTCGVMRSQTPLVKKKPGDFFFAGSFYWMRAKEVFERDWTYTDKTRWWVEYFSTHLFTVAESACIFHDLVPSSVLNRDYFAQHVEPEWSAWKAARGMQITLTEIANRLGCDKGTTANEAHGYTRIYESAIDEECTLLEIGIDKGQSLRMWAEWSEELDLIAIDNRTETMTDDLFMIADLHHCDQSSVDSLKDFANGMCRVDVIIDDGSHRPNDQLLTLETFWQLLKSGGKYFIEDLHCSAWFPDEEKAHARITAFAKRMGAAHSFFCDNKLAMLVKP